MQRGAPATTFETSKWKTKHNDTWILKTCGIEKLQNLWSFPACSIVLIFFPSSQREVPTEKSHRNDVFSSWTFWQFPLGFHKHLVRRYSDQKTTYQKAFFEQVFGNLGCVLFQKKAEIIQQINNVPCCSIFVPFSGPRGWYLMNNCVRDKFIQIFWIFKGYFERSPS